MANRRVILCAMLALAAMLSLLTGCGNTRQGDSAAGVHPVMLSNIKTMDSKLSDTEREKLKKVTQIIESATYDTGTGVFTAENTTGENLELRFYFTMYNANGQLDGETYEYLDEWRQGEVYRVKIRDHVAYLSAEYVDNGSYYKTDMVPIVTVRSENAYYQIKCEELPQRVSISDWNGTSEYELTDIESAINNGGTSYTLKLRITKLNGSSSLDHIGYRILREDGTVVYSGVLSIQNINPGESMLYIDKYVILQAGEYSIEFGG